MDNLIIDKAREIFKEPDIIIDLYDFSILWTSPKHEEITGFSREELAGKRVPDFFAVSKDEKKELAIQHMSKSHDTLEVISKTKKGYNVKFNVEFYTIEFNKGFYHIGRIISFSKVQKKK